MAQKIDYMVKVTETREYAEKMHQSMLKAKGKVPDSHREWFDKLCLKVAGLREMAIDVEFKLVTREKPTDTQIARALALSTVIIAELGPEVTAFFRNVNASNKKK